MSIKSVKMGKDILFEVWQTNSLVHLGKVHTYDFKKDAKNLADLHNKNQMWRVNGGLPKYLLD